MKFVQTPARFSIDTKTLLYLMGEDLFWIQAGKNLFWKQGTAISNCWDLPWIQDGKILFWIQETTSSLENKRLPHLIVDIYLKFKWQDSLLKTGVYQPNVNGRHLLRIDTTIAHRVACVMSITAGGKRRNSRTRGISCYCFTPRLCTCPINRSTTSPWTNNPPINPSELTSCNQLKWQLFNACITMYNNQNWFQYRICIHLTEVQGILSAV